MHSYYLQYQEYIKGVVDMIDFYKQMRGTNVFNGLSEQYIDDVFNKFVELLPVLQQIKQYK